jgi:hypothetical protein
MVRALIASSLGSLRPSMEFAEQLRAADNDDRRLASSYPQAQAP